MISNPLQYNVNVKSLIWEDVDLNPHIIFLHAERYVDIVALNLELGRTSILCSAEREEAVMGQKLGRILPFNHAAIIVDRKLFELDESIILKLSVDGNGQGVFVSPKDLVERTAALVADISTDTVPTGEPSPRCKPPTDNNANNFLLKGDDAVNTQFSPSLLRKAALGVDSANLLTLTLPLKDGRFQNYSLEATRSFEEHVRSVSATREKSAHVVLDKEGAMPPGRRAKTGRRAVPVPVQLQQRTEVQVVGSMELPYLTLEDVGSNRVAPLLGPGPGPALCEVDADADGDGDGGHREASSVLVVDDASGVEAFAAAVAALLRHCRSAEHRAQPRYNGCVVGLDCEWRPWRSHRDRLGEDGGEDGFPVETLQLSTRSGIFLLDLSSLARGPVPCLAALDRALASLLSEARIYKLGFEAMGDLERLAASYAPLLPSLLQWRAVLDLSPLARIALPGQVTKKRCGLGHVCRVLLGKALDKAQQCSAWHRRPLSARQIAYCALDAAVLIALYDGIVRSIHARFPSSLIDRYLEKHGLLFHAKFRVTAATDCTSSTSSSSKGQGAPGAKSKLLLGMAVRCIRWARQFEEPFFPVS
jgi:hypothetical protein